MTVNSGPRTRHIDIVFDNPPGPIPPHFVEVEDDLGRGIRFGNWVQRRDGYWVIRITPENVAHWFGTDLTPDGVCDPGVSIPPICGEG